MKKITKRARDTEVTDPGDARIARIYSKLRFCGLCDRLSSRAVCQHCVTHIGPRL